MKPQNNRNSSVAQPHAYTRGHIANLSGKHSLYTNPDDMGTSRLAHKP